MDHAMRTQKILLFVSKFSLTEFHLLESFFIFKMMKFFFLVTTALSLGYVSSFQQVTNRPLLPLTVSSSLSRKTSRIHMATDDADQSPTKNNISIEYCTGCRWMLKSFWISQELLTTFEDILDSITVIPSSTKGIFAVHLNGDNLLWDRKEQGGFPSPKELKQIVRDIVEPERFLGHSDSEKRQEEEGNSKEGDEKDVTASRVDEDVELTVILDEKQAPHPSVTITYCTGCRWLLRAAYFGQELLTTFGDDLKSVSLVPSKPPAKGGKFSIHLNGELIFDRSTEGRFPEVKEIKQMIRDKVVPDKDLGHSDVAQEEKNDDDDMDEDEAAEARRYFGVN